MTECWADSPHDRSGFGEILARLFQMMKDESDPVRAPAFYFGKRKKSLVDPSQYLDAAELAEGLLDADELAELKAAAQGAGLGGGGLLGTPGAPSVPQPSEVRV